MAGTAGVALFPTVLTSASWKGANDRISIAHIGTGSRGSNEIIRYFLPQKGALNRAVCDVYNSKRLRAAKIIDDYHRDHNITAPKCDVYHDFEEILERDDIDAVNIVTNDQWHVPMAYKAAQAGKHIMLAKPLGLSYPNFIKLQKAVRENDVRFHYSTQQRTSCHMKRARDMIQGGEIGEISRVEVWCPGIRPGGQYDDSTSLVCRPAPVPADLDYDRWVGPAPLHPYCPERVEDGAWFFINDYSIGFLAGWGAHPLDIMVWYLKDKVSGIYSCRGTGYSWPAGSLFDNIKSWDVHLEYQNGLKVHFVSLDRAERGALDVVLFRVDDPTSIERNGTTFYGSKGWISVSRNAAFSNILELHQALNDVPKRPGGRITGENNKMGKAFLDVIREDIPELCPLDEAILSDTISHMGNIAIRMKRKVTLDPVRGEVVNDSEANGLFIRAMRSPYQI